MNKINRIIYCIIDDVRASHFFKFIDKGLLPNFKKLMETGIYSKNCITDFPSVTFPTQPTQLTGTYTGDYRKELCHGIPLYNWMGRDFAPPILRDYGAVDLQVFKINEDLGPNCRTILEMVGDGNKTSIPQFVNRGTDFKIPKNKIQVVYFYLLINAGGKRNETKMMSRINTAPVVWLIENFKKPKKFFGNNEAPIASLLWFLTSDIIQHWYGYDSRLYKLNLMHIDKCMGILLDSLEEMGYLDDTAIAVTADHGNFKAKKIGTLTNFLQKNGLKQFHRRKNIKGNMDLAEFGSVGVFNFKGSNTTTNKYGWTHPTIKEMENYGPKHINLFNELFKIDGTVLMYYREDGNNVDKGKIILKRKDKKSNRIITGEIEYQGTGKELKTKYTSEDPNQDIFGYMNDDIASKFVDNKFHPLQEWLEATHHLDYPLYPDLMTRHFKNPRSCDIMVSTAGEVMFNIGHGKKKSDDLYSHDIGLRKSAVVPLIISGSPEIPIKEIPYCKTTDIVPTLLHCLGKKPHESVVGKNLI
jgi:hypothetical protein